MNGGYMNKKIIVIIMGVVVAIMIAVSVTVILNKKNDAPEIIVKVSDGEYTYRSELGKDKLLELVTVKDDKDGDLTKDVIIENVYVLSDHNTAKIVYAVKDSDNHISKKNLIVKYIASEEEIESWENTTTEELESDSMSSTMSTIAVIGTVGGTNIATSSTTERTSTELVSSGAMNAPIITMNSNEATIKAGDTFNITTYIESITDDKDTSDALYRRININGTYDTAKAGDYSITMYCRDSEGNKSNEIIFTLHVS